jgi:predicted HTH transcriptional regulator
MTQEQIMMDYLKENHFVTSKQLKNITGFPMNKIDKILSDFVDSKKVVRYEEQNKRFNYIYVWVKGV